MNTKLELRQKIIDMYNSDLSENELSEIEYNMLGFFNLLIDICLAKEDKMEVEDD